MALSKPTLTPEEYLRQERLADRRSEYLRGNVYAMAGATEDHVLIVGNCAGELRAQFRRRPCKVYSTALRVKVSRTGLYTYPDVVALCGEASFEEENRDTLLNPSLIVEVLSPSTEAYDRGGKFAHYRRIDTLVDYVLLSQDRMRLERYTRHSGGLWLFSEHSGPDEVVRFEGLGCELALADLYEKVEPAADGRGPE